MLLRHSHNSSGALVWRRQAGCQASIWRSMPEGSIPLTSVLVGPRHTLPPRRDIALAVAAMAVEVEAVVGVAVAREAPPEVAQLSSRGAIHAIAIEPPLRCRARIVDILRWRFLSRWLLRSCRGWAKGGMGVKVKDSCCRSRILGRDR